VIPLVAFGRWVRRLSRGAQDTLADATAYASELIGAIRTVQAYTSEPMANARFGGEVEQAYEAARHSTRARSVLTAVIIFIVFTSVVLILWVGSHDVVTGSITPAGSASSSCMPRSRQPGSASSARSGASSLRPPAHRNGYSKFFASSRRSRRRCRRGLCRCRRAATSASRMSVSPIRRGRMRGRLTACRCRCARREGGDRRPVRCRQEHAVSFAAAFYDPAEGRIAFDGVSVRDADPREVRARIALVPQTR